MTDKLDDIRSAHVELMVEYVHLINHTSKLRFLLRAVIFPLQKALPVFVTNTVFVNITLRFLVKLFVESHIKGKVNQLADSYVQLAQTLSTNKPFDIKYQNWLMQAEEGTRKFANTLSSFRSFRGLVGVVLPWIASFLIAMLSANIIQRIDVKINLLLIILGVILFILAIYLCLLLLLAFMYKRNLFYPSSDGFLVELIIRLLEFFKKKEVPQQREPAYNVYQLENKLFNLIGKKKTLELPIDSIIFSIFLFIYGTFLIIFLINGQEVEFSTIFVIAIFFIIVVDIFIMMVGFKRRWR